MVALTLSVAQRIALVVVGGALALAVVALTGVTANSHLAAANYRLVHEDMARVQALEQARYTLLQLRRAEKDALISMDMPQKHPGYVDTWHRKMGELAGLIERLPERTATGNPLRAPLLEQAGVYRAGMSALLPKLSNGEVADVLGAAITIEKFKGSVHDIEKRLGAEIEASGARSAQANLGLQATADARKNLILVVWLVSTVASAAAGIWLWRTTTRPLRAAMDHAASIARGDLTHRVAIDRRDEIGALLAGLNQMSDSLAGIVGQVREGTSAIALASREIAAGNADLSARTEQQASALQESAAAMEQMTATIRQSVQHAEQAHELADRASEVATRGGAVVRDVVHTMETINGSSKRIAEIVAVVDGIAFQTNILALNAAVEAARAGEQGRGFAVVASEVRTLAQRSAEAARDIKHLIESSVGAVDAGVAQVESAGRTMSEIVASVQRVTAAIGAITSASKEQSIGIEQVNQAVSAMDHATQQNAALVEQAAAAAESLQSQARVLETEVQQFKLAAV